MLNMGIDQALGITGVVITNDTKELIFYEYLRTKKDDFETKFHRIESIANRIVTIAAKYSPDKIIIEGLPFGMRNSNSTRDLAGLQAVIICKLIQFGCVTPTIIAPRACKLKATNDGNADKEKMKNALPKHVLKAFESTGAKKTTGIWDLADAWFLSLM